MNTLLELMDQPGGPVTLGFAFVMFVVLPILLAGFLITTTKRWHRKRHSDGRGARMMCDHCMAEWRHARYPNWYPKPKP